MADNNNPIKYSDLVQPDNSITDLISQLEKLAGTYTQTMATLKQEAIKVKASIEGVSGATKQGQEATRTASVEADKLAKAQEQLNYAQSETAKKLAELKQAQKEANDINKLTAKLNSSAEGSYNKLSAQYSLNKIRLNALSAEERKNTEEGRKLEAETKRIYEEMKRLQESTGKYQLNVGNYTKSMMQALGVNNQFGQSLIALGKGGEESVMAFTAMKNGAMALGNTLMGLLTNPVFLAIAGIAGAGVAFKWWYDYNAGLQEATKMTAEFTGKSGNDLKAFRNEVSAIADTFGKDFKETLQATNAMASQFGISFDNAMDIIKDGFVAGADLNGVFLAKIGQYAPYFKEAGLSAKQFTAILTQTRSGIFGDKGLDAIKQANARIREMSTSTAKALDNIGISSKQVQADLESGTKTTFDVLQEVSAKLSELPPSSQIVGETLMDVFGKQGRDAGLEMIKSLQNINTNLDEVKAGTGELGQLQEEEANAEIELQNALSALFDQTGGNFEKMRTGASLFVKKGLTAIIKGVVDLINWFVRLYNKSLAIRSLWSAVVVNFKTGLNGIGNLFNFFIDIIKAVGTALEGVFTLSFDKFKQGVTQFGKALPKLVGATIKDFANAVGDSIEHINDQMQEIQIPVSFTGDDDATIPVVTGGGSSTAGGGSGKGTSTGRGTGKRTTKPSDTKKAEEERKKEEDKQRKEAEEAYKKTLDARRKYEDAVLKSETDEWKKRTQQTTYQYDRQIEDLKHQLLVEQKLTTEQKEYINKTIQQLELQKTADLERIENERNLKTLEWQKQGIDLRLQAVREGSDEELQLKREQIENERQTALTQNALLQEDARQNADDINAVYNEKIASLADDYINFQMEIFDKQQELAQSEYDLLENSEERKTRFRLQAEKQRLQKILALNEMAGHKMTEMEVQTILNTIARIDKEIEQSKSKEKGQDIYGLFGLNLTDDKKNAIQQSIDFAKGQLDEILNSMVESANIAVQASEKEIQTIQKRLDAELQARANGYASNVEQAQKDLELAKKTNQKAKQEQEKAQRAQLAIQSVEQMSNLVTASSMIWSQLGFPWAIPAIATMWGSFALAKVKAMQVTKQNAETYGEGTIELLEGGSHQSGNDIDLGTKTDGTRRRAEGGEFFAVINKRNSRKYRRIIPDVIKSLNNGSFAHKYLSSFDHDGLTLNVGGNSAEMRELNDNVKAIREQGKTRTYTDSRGNMVVEYKNIKRTYTR